MVVFPGSMTRFGECSGFPQRMVLLYDGIHYDSLYLQLPGQLDKQTVFPVSDLRYRYDPLYLPLSGWSRQSESTCLFFENFPLFTEETAA
jgi:hypothetical protein